MEIEGRVAVVTGGASGIGRAIAERLIGCGALVVLADRDEHRVAATAREIGAVSSPVDVSDAEAMRALAEEVVTRHGGVDILVSNAGVAPMAPLAQVTEEDWRWILGVNLFGAINGVRAFLPILEANPRGGRIVVTASMSSFAPSPGLGAYSVTKAAVAMYAEALREELLADGSAVSVSVIAPGPVRTGLGAGSLRGRADGATAFEQHDLLVEAPELDWIDADDVAVLVERGIRDDRGFIITHPHRWPEVAARYEELREAFGATGP